MELHLRCTIGVERDLPLVPHFVEYYRRLGVESYLFVLHTRDAASPNLARAGDLLRGCGIEPATIWITPNWNTGANAEKHRQVVQHLSETAWVMSADIDEFHEYPKPLPAFLEELSGEGYELVRGRLVQRVSRTFRLAPLRPDTDLFVQCPVEADFGIGNPGKVMLHRKHITTTPGHHHFDEPTNRPVRIYPHILKVAHFKWFEGVGKKYTDASLMAHHSETWEFAAYDRFIQRNFSGWRRWMNVATHHRVIQPWLRAVLRLKRAAGTVRRRLLPWDGRRLAWK